jgi:GT2 family glycosyltransferase
MDLSIIVVSWNTRELLRACLDSVLANPPACSYDVWVVDNDSSDGSAEMVQTAYPQVHLIVNAENVGFAGANNQAIRASNGRYLLLLNPDTDVQPDGLTSLVAFLEQHPEAGGAGSLLLNPDRSLQLSCHPLPSLSRELWRLLHGDRLLAYAVYPMDAWDVETPRPVDIVQGASLMLRRDILDRVGLLDDSYFMYSEEVDLCYRIKKAGWQLYWVPQSKVIHYGGQSTKQVAADMFIELYRGKLAYFRKNYGRAAAQIYKLILTVTALPRVTAAPLLGHLSPAKRAEYEALGANYRRLLHELPGL